MFASMTNNIDLQATLKSLRAIAAAQVAQHPQYANHFANYRLVRVKRDVTTKLRRKEAARAIAWAESQEGI